MQMMPIVILKPEEMEIIQMENKAVRYFTEIGLGDRIKEFDHSSATVALAAQALGCEER